MLNVEINEPAKSKGIPAQEIPTDSLFRDEDGDLYVKVRGGAIRFGDDSLIAYSNSEVCDFDFLKNCVQVKGKVSITVDLKG